MTLRQPNIDRMLQLGLTGMAEALEEQRDVADIDQLGFNDRLAMMIEREAGHRDHKSYLGHLRQAQLRIRADVQDVDCRAGRGIARTTLTQLAAGDWIPVQQWPEVIGEPTIADAVLDRIVHNAYRIDLKGESQRKRNRPPPLDGGNDK